MRGVWLLVLCALCTAVAAQSAKPPAHERKWRALAKDNVHDPRSPAIGQLQEPRDALSALPPDTAGNQVRWVEALRSGSINPRTSLQPETKVRLLETEIIMSRHGSLRAVRFPHLEHTLWLDGCVVIDPPLTEPALLEAVAVALAERSGGVRPGPT